MCAQASFSFQAMQHFKLFCRRTTFSTQLFRSKFYSTSCDSDVNTSVTPNLTKEEKEQHKSHDKQENYFKFYEMPSHAKGWADKWRQFLYLLPFLYFGTQTANTLDWNGWIPGIKSDKIDVQVNADNTKKLNINPDFQKVDYKAVAKDIQEMLEENYNDDGPLLVRLAWHASGTYDKKTNTGGSNGATMRFHPESNHGANNGLSLARNMLQKIKKKHPDISYADLWTLAGVVAIRSMGGPITPWHPGRSDAPDDAYCVPDGRLPDASKGVPHLKDIFYRMGFNDKEIVALSGAHVLGRCHTDRSGYEGPWGPAPTVFSNDYFVQLTTKKWQPRKWNGPLQYCEPNTPPDSLMMLPSDMCMLDEPFAQYTKEFAKDQDLFFNEFSKAFAKLLELGWFPPPNSKEIKV